MTDTLRPVEVSEYYIHRVASGMSRYFWDNIFKEIFDILKDNTVYNSKDDVLNAIRKGSIWYENGAFRGKFNNSISQTLEQMGAKFKYNAYYIPKANIPFEYVRALEFVQAQAAAKASRISNFLGGLGSILSKLSLKQYIEATVDLMYRKLQLDIVKSALEKNVPIIELDIVKPQIKLPKKETKDLENYWKEQDKKADDLRKAIKEAAKKGKDTQELKDKLSQLNIDAFQNAPKVEVKIDDIALDEKSKKIAQDYTYNMEFWVKKWEAKNIVKMREDILKMIGEGARVPKIAEYFEKRWKVAKDKALFLAVNESHLAASVIKAADYQALGANSFVWGRSSSREKRELHKTYYGQTFSFDDPPILDEKLGVKGLPRQIWNCKCHMLIKPPTMAEIINKHSEVRNAKRNIFEKIKYTIKNSKQRNTNIGRYRRFGEGQTL